MGLGAGLGPQCWGARGRRAVPGAAAGAGRAGGGRAGGRAGGRPQHAAAGAAGAHAHPAGPSPSGDRPGAAASTRRRSSRGRAEARPQAGAGPAGTSPESAASHGASGGASAAGLGPGAGAGSWVQAPGACCAVLCGRSGVLWRGMGGVCGLPGGMRQAWAALRWALFDRHALPLRVACAVNKPKACWLGSLAAGACFLCRSCCEQVRACWLKPSPQLPAALPAGRGSWAPPARAATPGAQ